MSKLPPLPPQAPPAINVDLSKASDLSCNNCGNYTFQQVVLLKKFSAITSPTGQEGIAPIPVFACNACGFVNDEFLPRTMRGENKPATVAPEKPKLSLS
jgi:uncharacterized Zn finger protein